MRATLTAAATLLCLDIKCPAGETMHVPRRRIVTMYQPLMRSMTGWNRATYDSGRRMAHPLYQYVTPSNSTEL